MAVARASTRLSIAWSGADPIEDTDTLVLTIDGYSLDLRVFIDGPNKGEIDWSTVALVKQLEGSTSENPILRWDHLIDSRPPTDLPDQGTFATLANGDVLETGTMYNPKTMLNEAYMETWRRFPQSPKSPYFVLERDQPGLDSGMGFIGRLGKDALGICKLGDKHFYAWRDRLENGEWNRLYHFGDDKLSSLLPSLPTDISKEWVKNGQAKLHGGEGKWTVKVVGHL